MNYQVWWVQTLQFRSQDSATETYTIFPISCSPQTILCHHKYPVSFLWSISQNYSIRHHILAWTFPDISYSKEGTNTACYRSKSELPFESTQRERENNDTHIPDIHWHITSKEEHMKKKHPKLKGVPLPHQTFLHEEQLW